MGFGACQWEVFITMRLYSRMNWCESGSKMNSLCVLKKTGKMKGIYI